MLILRRLLVLAALAGAARSAPAQFTPPQLLPGDLTAFPSAGDQRNVQIARGAGQSLMVWEDTRAGLSGTVSTGGNPQPNFDLCAARLDDAGNLLDTTALVLRSAPFSQTRPKVAWNGQSYLVVWSEEIVHAFSADMGVLAMRVSPTGQVLDDPPILLEDREYVDDESPCVASDGSGWVVMWSGLSDTNTNAVRGCPVAADGTAGSPQTLLAAASGFYFPVNFEVAYTAGRYLFVSEHFPQGGSSNHVFGQLFDTALVKLGAQFDIGQGTGFGTNPSVAGNGAGFAVAWNDYADIRATPVSTTGVSAVPGGVAVSGGTYVAYQLPCLTWDGANWLIAFSSSFQTAYGLRAARMDAAGTLLGGAPFVVDAGPAQIELPACVRTATGSLLVWSDARNAISNYNADRTDLYGATISAGGTPGASTCYSISPPAQTDAEIAGDAAHGFLVSYLAQTASTASIQAQRVDGSGAAIDAQPIAIASGVRTLVNPYVAWNGSVWLVTWEQIGNGPFAPAQSIVGARVAPDGTVLDATPIAIMPGSGPEAAAVGDEFLVVATHEPSNHFRSVFTRRVRGSDGALLDPAPVQLTGSYDTQVTVTAFSDRWMIAWSHTVTHDSPYASIRFLMLPVGGSPTPYAIGGDAGFTNNGPRLASDGAQAMLAWYANGDVYARRILADGTKLDSDAGILVSGANNAQFTPSIAWTGTNFLVAYDDYRLHTTPLEPGLGDVYATHVLASGAVVEPAGIAIAAGPLLPECLPAVAGDQGLGLIAYSSLEAAAPLGTWRIAVRGETQSVATYCTAKVNSLGCTPAIGWSGTPSASAGSGFPVTAANVLNNKNGLFFYGLAGQQAVPFQGGVLCVKLPIRRTAVQGSGGNPPPNDCSGAFALDFNVYIASGADPALVAGAVIDGQYWSRDPGFAPPNNVGLTDALHAVIGP